MNTIVIAVVVVAVVCVFGALTWKRVGAVIFWRVLACRRFFKVRKWKQQHAGEYQLVDRLTGGVAVVKGGVAAPPLRHCRVVMVSDTHCMMGDVAPTLPPGDVLLHTGDVFLLSWKQKGTAAATAAVARFGRGLAAIPPSFTTAVVIGGNHDFAFEALGRQAVQAVLSDVVRALRPTLRVVYLEHQGVVLDNGLRVYGSPVSVGCSHNKAFQPATPDDLCRQVHAGLRAFVAGDSAHTHPHSEAGGLATHVDVVMLHGPPDRATRDAIVHAAAPALVCFGHLHARHGVKDATPRPGGDGLPPTVWVNASSVDSGYAPVHHAIVMDLPVPAAE